MIGVEISLLTLRRARRLWAFHLSNTLIIALYATKIGHIAESQKFVSSLQMNVARPVGLVMSASYSKLRKDFKMAGSKWQMTFHIGSGERGKQLSELLNEQSEKLNVKDDTKTLRVAIRVLDKLSKDHPAVKAALAMEGLS